MYEQLCSWTFKFRKVVRQHISGGKFYATFFAVYLRMQEVKELLKSVNVRAKVIAKRLRGCFSTHSVLYLY